MYDVVVNRLSHIKCAHLIVIRYIVAVKVRTNWWRGDCDPDTQTVAAGTGGG